MTTVVGLVDACACTDGLILVSIAIVIGIHMPFLGFLEEVSQCPCARTPFGAILRVSRICRFSRLYFMCEEQCRSSLPITMCKQSQNMDCE